MAFWSNDFMAKMRKDWMNHIAKVQYYAGGKWYDTAITGKTVSGNTICITTQTMDNLALTITAVRLIDSDGQVAGSAPENITKLADQGVITKWEFPLYEVS